MIKKLFNILRKDRLYVDKRHQRYIDNVDYFSGVIEQQIAEHKLGIETELDSVDYIDEFQKKAALEIYDIYMKDIFNEMDLRRTTKRKISKRFDKAKRVFEKKILKQIHRFGMSIEQTKLSATFGEATGKGHVITNEWRQSVRDMLSEDAARFRIKLYSDTILDFVSLVVTMSIFFAAVLVFFSILTAQDVSFIRAILNLNPVFLAALLGVLVLKVKVKPIKYGFYIDRYFNKVSENYFSEIIAAEQRARKEEQEKEREKLKKLLDMI